MEIIFRLIFGNKFKILHVTAGTGRKMRQRRRKRGSKNADFMRINPYEGAFLSIAYTIFCEKSICCKKRIEFTGGIKNINGVQG